MMFSTPEMNSIYLNTLYGTRNTGTKRELDKDAFLRLLITELKHQNPLEPLNNKDLIEQLSQLTSLENITNMTKTVMDFVEANANFMKAQAASMIGKTVVVRSNNLTLQDGKTGAVFFNLDEPAKVVVKIVNERGDTVYYKDLGNMDAGLQYFIWDGKNNEGVAMPDGHYYYYVYKINPDGTQEEIGGLESGVVEAVQFNGKDIFLLVNGQKYSINSIVEISGEVNSL